MSKKIDLLLPPLHRQHFSGGVWCLIQYARGLANQGYDVRIVPMLPSPRPEWAPEVDGLTFVTEERAPHSRLFAMTWSLTRSLLPALLFFRKKQLLRTVLDFLIAFEQLFAPFLPFEFYRAHALAYIRSKARETDVVIATFYETAVAAKFYPATRRLYFCQHLEVLFYRDMVWGDLSRIDAEISYLLDLEVVANSSWLRQKLAERGLQAKLCCNAINKEFFSPPAQPATRKAGELILISYGGRNVDWKGFEEMAKAVAIARAACPDLHIAWRVFGVAALPPENAIATYEDLGFLQQHELGDAYRNADILLSASWYESFPLFPLEAMACGLPVIATQPGTEDFCRHLETAYVVTPRDERSIAAGIITLAKDKALRERIAAAGLAESLRFDWPRSVARMQAIIEGADE